ncbi:hypothetical protein BpKM390_45560 [Burkholderia pseudomallei]|nr:hypothetical protein BpKM390_45560 [Burkholderia pseudomallei]
MRPKFADEGAQFRFIVGHCLVVQALSVPIERDGVMLAFADIDTDEDVDGVMLLVLLHRSMCGMNELACNLGGESRHPRYGRPQICLGRAPISDHQPPTRPGDNTPPDHERLGAGIMPGLAGQSPNYRGMKIVTGARRVERAAAAHERAAATHWGDRAISRR